MQLCEVQKIIKTLYLHRDLERGLEKTFVWFIEEVGELATAIKDKNRKNLENEFADVLAWLISLANLLDIDIEYAFISKYGNFCPRCKCTPCRCPKE
ncbi:MAG: nucleotide pyrophosphohydrolase [Candidatus Methanomethylicia archaeon]|nr:nucleotide pyrophosphohydrolase [Candidatus Methanomethylicia archaeon]MCX8169132.1 nucleotide pyrophosphohydrolase [Candidatus Methanomethylicia archaeon]MDW7988864.1 MazG nucleotide pyrophosphohydrolase domain-containing protein [Nitrososphaerota archaeon]